MQDDGTTTEEEEEEEEEEGTTTRPMPIRVKVMQNGDCGSSERPSVGFSMSWTKMTPSPLAAAADDDGGGIGSSGNDTDARSRSSGRTTLLLPHLPAAEERRDELQSSLAQGWGTWYQPNILSITKLPEGAVVGIELCRISTSVCLTQAVPDGRFRHYDASARVDLHAWDRSYAQFYVGPRGGPEDVSTFVNANVSIELGASGETNEDLVVLVTPVACDGGLDCTDYELRLRGRYAWSRAGQVRSFATSEGAGIEFSSAGLGAFNITIINHNGIGEEDPNSAIIIPLLKGGIEFGTNVSNGRKHLGNARARELARIEESFGSKSEVAKAIQAAVMWTCIYTPVENGPLMTVSRSWGHSAPSGLDWTYVLYEWDTFFASLLAGLGDKRIAYSNLFQVVKSKTSAGFIPNFYFGGTSSQDRTEPPVGAKVLLEIYRKFRDDWVVELAFDDLLDWHRWFKHHRWLRKFGLIALGSWNQQQERTGMGDPGNDMQSARLESGLDNSPMYDGDFFDNSTTHLMELADVGMSSLFVQEAFALSELANAIGRPEASSLRKTGEMVAKNIKMYLWDDDSGVYTNRFSNTSFHRVISPTSFYSMQSFAPSDPQVARMAKEWLLNSSRFCLRKDTKFDLSRDCFWGLPSISADDPTYLKPGVWNYWRGFTWGPMAMLTYWSLQNYAYLQPVQHAKKALCGQMENMMMKQWVDNRIICENYDPRKEFGGQCGGTATPFYHWGALIGFIGLVEDGHWGGTETPLSSSRIFLHLNDSAIV